MMIKGLFKKVFNYEAREESDDVFSESEYCLENSQELSPRF